MNPEKISHDTLVNQGFCTIGINEYYQPSTKVKVVGKTSDTGKLFYVYNGKVVKYMIELFNK